jgi:hypothetical protein
VPFVLGALNLNEPSAPVCADTLVPFTVTVTPERGAPLFASVTVPVTVFCAKEAVETNNDREARANLTKPANFILINVYLVLIGCVKFTQKENLTKKIIKS